MKKQIGLIFFLVLLFFSCASSPGFYDFIESEQYYQAEYYADKQPKDKRNEYYKTLADILFKKEKYYEAERLYIKSTYLMEIEKIANIKLEKYLLNDTLYKELLRLYTLSGVLEVEYNARIGEKYYQSIMEAYKAITEEKYEIDDHNKELISYFINAFNCFSISGNLDRIEVIKDILQNYDYYIFDTRNDIEKSILVYKKYNISEADYKQKIAKTYISAFRFTEALDILISINGTEYGYKSLADELLIFANSLIEKEKIIYPYNDNFKHQDTHSFFEGNIKGDDIIGEILSSALYCYQYISYKEGFSIISKAFIEHNDYVHAYKVYEKAIDLVQMKRCINTCIDKIIVQYIMEYDLNTKEKIRSNELINAAFLKGEIADQDKKRSYKSAYYFLSQLSTNEYSDGNFRLSNKYSDYCTVLSNLF